MAAATGFFHRFLFLSSPLFRPFDKRRIPTTCTNSTRSIFRMSTLSVSTQQKQFPYWCGDRIILPPCSKSKLGDFDWTPEPLRVSSISREILRNMKGDMKADNRHWLIKTHMIGVELDSEEELFDFYVQSLARYVGSEEEAKKRIYLVSCGYSYGFGAEFDIKTMIKITGDRKVGLDVFSDAYYYARTRGPNVQSDVHFTPLNQNLRLDNIFSYHHLSKHNSKWNSDHWLINIKLPDGGFTDRSHFVDYCINMLAKIVGSVEAAMEKIYIAWFKFPFGFGAEIDEATSNKLRVMAKVSKVLPDYSIDIKAKVYGPFSALHVLPACEGLIFSHYNLTEEHGLKDGIISREEYVGDTIYYPAVQYAPEISPVQNYLLNDLFSYYHHSEHSSASSSDRWLINVKQPNGEFPTEQDTIDFCVQLLAEVLESEQEARRKIYLVWCKMPFGFAAKIDEETSKKLKGMRNVLTVLPDYASNVNNTNRVLVISPSSCERIRRSRIHYCFNYVQDSN